MITINIKNKELNPSKIEEWIVEDERNRDEISFTITDDSITDLYFYLLYRNAEGKGGAERLEKTVNGSTVSLLWNPSHNFTQTEGEMLIQVVGFEFEQVEGEWRVKDRWSTLSAQITIQTNIEADELAPDVTWDLAEHYLALIEADLQTYEGIKDDMDTTYDTFNTKYGDFNTKYEDFNVKYDDVISTMLKATLFKGQDNEYSVLSLEGVRIGENHGRH